MKLLIKYCEECYNYDTNAFLEKHGKQLAILSLYAIIKTSKRVIRIEVLCLVENEEAGEALEDIFYTIALSRN